MWLYVEIPVFSRKLFLHPPPHGRSSEFQWFIFMTHFLFRWQRGTMRQVLYLGGVLLKITAQILLCLRQLILAPFSFK
jgi:hypothetical protein